jgi:hypothetical protein
MQKGIVSASASLEVENYGIIKMSLPPAPAGGFYSNKLYTLPRLVIDSNLTDLQAYTVLTYLLEIHRICLADPQLRSRTFSIDAPCGSQTLNIKKYVYSRLAKKLAEPLAVLSFSHN